MSSATKFIPHYSVEDYLAWEGDWELWDGIPISMSPSPNYFHQSVGAKLLSEFSQQLRGDPCGQKCEAVYELDWHVSESTVVRPDLMVLCEKPKGQWVEKPPSVIVEILSPSTREKDLVAKRDLYAENGVSYYLIIDPDKESIVLLELDSEGTYREISSHNPFPVHDGCSLKIDGKGLFSRPSD